MRYAVDSILYKPSTEIAVQRISARLFQNIDLKSSNVEQQLEDILESIGIEVRTDFERINRGDTVLFTNYELSIIFAPRWNRVLHHVRYRSEHGFEDFPVVSLAQYHYEQSLLMSALH